MALPTVTLAQGPLGLIPAPHGIAGHFLGQIHTLEPREGPGQLQGPLRGGALTSNDGAILGALVPQNAGQPPGIDV